MSALVITAANILATDSADTSTLIAGVAITAGQVVYKDSSDSDKAKLADADLLAAAKIEGIALNNAAAGQPVTILRKGTLGGLPTIVVGGIYCLGTTAGTIVPYADLNSDDRLIIIGFGDTTATIKLNIIDTAIVLP